MQNQSKRRFTAFFVFLRSHRRLHRRYREGWPWGIPRFPPSVLHGVPAHSLHGLDLSINQGPPSVIPVNIMVFGSGFYLRVGVCWLPRLPMGHFGIGVTSKWQLAWMEVS